MHDLSRDKPFIIVLIMLNTQDPTYLIRYFLFLSFASLEELGFDTTVTRLLSLDGSLAFIYATENNKYYRTIDCPLSEHGAFALLSRGVRVWKVKQCSQNGTFLEKDGTTHVLKDCWIFDDVKNEKEMQEMVLDKLGQKGSDGAEFVKKHLLTIIDCGTVVVGGRPDKTTAVPGGTISILNLSDTRTAGTSRSQTKPAHPRPQSIRAPVHGAEGNQSQNDTKFRHHCRKHVRMVFEECCITFYEISNYDILIKATIPLVKGEQLVVRTAHHTKEDSSQY